VLDFFLDSFRTPPFLLPIYLAAAQRYGVPWQVLAAINEVESDYGLDLSTSSAGAEGWMQFLPQEWLTYGVDANGWGVRDPYNPADAIFATARYLAAAGSATNLRGAIYAYNHSSSYVESVILRSQLIAAAPQSLISSLTAVVSGRFPVEGTGPHTATATFSNPPRPSDARSAIAAHSSPTGAPAPWPQLAATSTSEARSTVVGALITASSGAPVVAVQGAQIIRIGRDATLGRFIEVRDAYGDRYVYGRLGRVLKRYTQTPSSSAHGAQSGAATFAPLRVGTLVTPGTVLGSVPSGAPGTPEHFLFEIRPAGAGPIDPRPILQSWQLLGETQGRPQAGTAPLFGPDAGDALINEIQLLSAEQLQARLLSDAQLPLSSCARQDIAAGQVDRRVLATLDFLLASGLDPTVSGLECSDSSVANLASRSAGANVDAVAITQLNGIPIHHDGRGSLTELAARRLVALPAAMRPHQIDAPLRLQGSAATLVRPGPADRLEIGFEPPAPRSQRAGAVGQPATPGGSSSALATGPQPAVTPSNSPRLDPALGTAQWRRLLKRLSSIPEPRVPSVPTGSAVPDNSGSPPPAAEPLAGAVPPQPASSAAGALGTSHALKPKAAVGRLGLNAPLDEATPLTSQGLVLKTESTFENKLEADGPVLQEEVDLITEAAGQELKSTEYQIAPAESESCSYAAGVPSESCWETIDNENGQAADEHTVFSSSTRQNGEPRADGLYDLRVRVSTAADAAGESTVSELRDRLIANSSPVVTLVEPGADLSGNITLKAELPSATNAPSVTSVSFQWSPHDEAKWTQIGEPVAVAGPNTGCPSSTKKCVSASLDTEILEDAATGEKGNGEYDFRAVPAHEGESFASIPVRKVLVDNTPPAVELVSPAAPLKGQVTLSAKAEDRGAGTAPGSGVASVRFQVRSQVGVSGWKNIGGTEFPSNPDTYSHTFDTESLANGSYDFRAIAVDAAGNEATSPVLTGIEVKNAALSAMVPTSIAGVVAPAEDIKFLGAIADSPKHEAWAYGFTSAPPAEAEGTRLSYEEPGEGRHLVLLRYTAEGGWQIADVLREPNGSIFKLLAPDKVEVSGIHVAGAMAPSGEAWLSVAEEPSEAGVPPVVGLFRRAPGGQFVLDREAMQQLGPLLESNSPSALKVNLRLGETNGQVYGMLTAPGQAQQASGEATQGLRYGLLTEGKWTLQSATPPSGLLNAGDEITLKLGDIQGPGEGWGAFEVRANHDIRPGVGLILGHFQTGEHGGEWTFARTSTGALGTGLDALDLTGAAADAAGSVEPLALKADGNDVWIEAGVRLPPQRDERAPVVARYDLLSGRVEESWCTLPGVANHCNEPLDPDHPAAVPNAIFETEDGPVALALRQNFVDVFAHGEWRSVAAPGYGSLPGPGQPPLPQSSGEDAFSSPNEGWLTGPGAHALGQWSAQGNSSPLASWPLPDRSPLTGVALPANSDGGIGESGAVAVGFGGTTLSYASGEGWLIQPVPPRARHLNLLGVAFAGGSSAFAVGQFGVILHWNGSAWSEDPQSISITDSQLNAVAFAPSGEGWAVGANGTILHYDGADWSIEPPPAADTGIDITSVAVAGSSLFAVAGGNLITRAPGGGWVDVPSSALPAPALKRGSLRLVGGLPDGGLVVAGNSAVLVREAAGEGFNYAAQPLQGIAVALAPFREADGKLRAYVSIAPSGDEGSPPGDGELMRQTAGGWQDLSRAQYPASNIEGDGAVKSDPVLAVASSPDGEHAWAVGGYDGTKDAAERGTTASLPTRPAGWQTASLWRYDTTGSAEGPGLAPTTPNLPAKPGTVSFAFFTSPMCRTECVGVQDAQPDVNLTSAAKQIATYAEQPGGPAFAMLGGNAVGPVEGGALLAGRGKADFAQLPELLAPLGSLPTFAALGRFDNDPQEHGDEARPWAEAFANAPPPLGSGTAAPGITPISSQAPTGEAHLFYAFDATQNGGTVRVIVLDNSKGSLEASATGQSKWLSEQLEAAEQASRPVVVMAARPLRQADTSDGESVASLLAERDVLAVFTTDGAGPASGENAAETKELDEHHLVPENPSPGVSPIPEYEGASLGYQQLSNNGVKWYFVSIDTHARATHVAAIPVLDSLSLKAVDGLNVARSLTLKFEAVGRRPAGTLATKAGEKESFPGFDSYVQIPATSCGKSPCVQPSYSFTSSEPTIGDFVEPSGEGSPVPKLNSGGHPIPSSSSGLFCAYNSGSTTVTITAGLLSYSLPVTVQPGNIGSPCGTVFRPGVGTVVVLHSSQTQAPARGAAAPPPPPPAALSGVSPTIAFLAPPPALQPPAAVPAAPKPLPAPTPPVPEPPLPQAPPEQVGASPAIVPPATPPVEPIPPGGAAQAPSAAERKEKARKHASQSAFTIRPAGTSAETWFFGALGVTTVVVLLLTARALPAAPRRRPALLYNRSTQDQRTGGRRDR
jgi:photosystem II stability/assembly factor-like uncharacterized protein